MSVDKRRLAAAQRTAVGRDPSRARRLGAWIIIVPALALFSFSVVAGAAGANAKPDVVSAAAKVVPPTHDDGRGADPGAKDNSKDGKGKKDDGTLVVVESSHDDGGIADALGRGGHEICWVSKSQLVRVSTVYKTTTSSLKVGNNTYSLVTVLGANERTLRQLLGTSAVQCRLVHVAKLFFLPFDPNLS